MENPDKFRKTVVYKIDKDDLERFIAETYSLPAFEITECANDSDYEYGVNLVKNTGPIGEYEAKTVQSAKDHRSIEHWKLGSVLEDLCFKGNIVPGWYLLNVCW